jgi:hypothetical protein
MRRRGTDRRRGHDKPGMAQTTSGQGGATDVASAAPAAGGWGAPGALGALGGLVYAAAGAVMGSTNAGWVQPRGANALMPALGVGIVLVAVAAAGSGWARRLWHAGEAGRVGCALVVLSPVAYLVSWAVEFALIGTLAFGLGLVLLAVAAWRHRVGEPGDRVLLAVAATGSLTWNTETTSAFLLVAVGICLAALGLRLAGPSADPS